MALQLQTLQLKKNTLIINAHPVEIDDSGVIKKTPKEIEDLKALRVFRTGIVVEEGSQDYEIRENFRDEKGEVPLTFKGCIVLFMANGVNPIDVLIEGVTTPILINTEYLISIIDESKSTPY